MQVGLKGLDNAIAALRSLEAKVSKKIVTKGLRAGAKIVARQAQANAPVRSGATKGAIKVRAGKRRKGKVSVAVMIGPGWFKGKSYYASFDILGHHVGSRKLGDARKWIPGKPWFKNAASEAAEAALGAIRETINQMIQETPSSK